LRVEPIELDDGEELFVVCNRYTTLEGGLLMARHGVDEVLVPLSDFDFAPAPTPPTLAETLKTTDEA